MEHISLSIKKEKVNEFLQVLWERLDSEIGTMGCQHFYRKTDDPQIYNYHINWCSGDTPFKATIVFRNHTSKGITGVDLDVLDKINDEFDYESFSSIKEIIIETAKCRFEDYYQKSLFKVPINSCYQLSGEYHFQKSDVLIKQEEDNLFLYFHLGYISRKNLPSKIIDKTKSIVSSLTLMTQTVFTFDESRKILELTSSIEKIKTKATGIYTSDNDYICYDELFVGGKLTFPIHTDLIVKEIINSKIFEQSSKRYHEALMMRGSTSAPTSLFNISSGHLIQYELLAYVSSIEALLDSSKVIETEECPKCGHEIEKEEYKISKKFREFVSNYSKNAFGVIEAMKQLYVDRSKFVHTGLDLHFYASRGNGPLTINGKNVKTEAPNYYFNIHEYTGWLIRNYFYSHLNITS